ncbi:MAG: serine hydroxymethyltransferase [Legionellales bacterium]|nr:serine hydroxymethyltransferase [Legionellales bacterium]
MKQSSLADYDSEIFSALALEEKRQIDNIELIASENYTSKNVMALQGSILTNKYAEGYPGKRYYGGCQYVDIVEELATERLISLFGASYANVQPHSGSQANEAVYQALLVPGDKVLAMSLNDGGHLSHGSAVNFSGKIYSFVHYGVDSETGMIDYEQVADLARKHKPKLIVAGFSAYSRIVDWQIFRDIADDVGAYLLVDMAHIAGLVAADLYPNPIPIADVVTSTTHKTLRGPRGGIILARENPEIKKKLASAVFPGLQGGPLMHVIAAKAVAFKEAASEEFRKYQKQVLENAKTMSESFAANNYNVISGGTDNHMFLLDLRSHGITGKQAEVVLDEVNITVNKNSVPNETESPFITSGIRIGTPAITTRGFKKAECQKVAALVDDRLSNLKQTGSVDSIKESVRELCQKFPVYR